jgi:hypothetical protein
VNGVHGARFGAWAVAHVSVFLMWGSVLASGAAAGQRSLFFAALAAGLVVVVAVNGLRLPLWLSSIVLFTIFEPPALMMVHTVAIGGLSILPYKILPVLGLAVFLAQRAWMGAGGGPAPRWGAPSPALLGIALLCFTAMLAAVLSVAPPTATGKAFTLCLTALSLVATAALARSADERHLARTLSLAIALLFGLTCVQAAHYFGVFPDRLFWYRFEDGMWLRFGVVGPQRAYASFHNPNYLPLWATVALLVLKHLAAARPRHYAMVFLLSLASLSASGVVTVLVAFVLPALPRAARTLAFATLLLAPLVALPLARATPLPDHIASGSGRQYIAWAAADAVYGSPIYGIGIGILDQHFERWGPENYHNTARVAHNFTWETLVSTGALGLLGLYLLYGALFRATSSSPALQSALLAFLVWGQWQPGLTWLPIWVLLGLLIGLSAAREEPFFGRAVLGHAPLVPRPVTQT